MSEQENQRTVEKLFECFGSGDLPGFLALLDEDVDWEVMGPEVVPYFGPRRGHGGALDFLGKLSDTVEFEEFAPEEFAAAGDKVFVTGRERGQVRDTGKTFYNPWAMVFTLAGGKITRFRSYEDTHAVAQAFEER